MARRPSATQPAAAQPKPRQGASALRILAAFLIVPLLFPALLTVTRAVVQRDYDDLLDAVSQAYVTYFLNYDRTPNGLMIGAIYAWEAAAAIFIWLFGRRRGFSFLNTVLIFLIVSEVLLLGFSLIYFTRIAAVQHLSVMRDFSVDDMIVRPHLYNLILTGVAFVLFWITSGLPWFRGRPSSAKASKERLGFELS